MENERPRPVTGKEKGIPDSHRRRDHKYAKVNLGDGQEWKNIREGV